MQVCEEIIELINMLNIKDMPIRFLQVVLDDMSFFDSVTPRFEADERLLVTNVIIVKDKDYKFKCIKNHEKVTVLWNKRMVRDFFKKGEYDVVHLYTLIPQHWNLIKYIPKDKKIIWWAWGWDLYDSFLGLDPLLKVDRLKPQTMSLIDERKSLRVLVKKLVYECLRPINQMRRNNVLKRMDYITPVFPIEYEMLCKSYPGFRADIFFRSTSINPPPEAAEKNPNGNVLFGNSSTSTNNHLDVWEYIKSVSLCEGQTLFMPLNYGDSSYGDIVQQVITKECPNAKFLREMIEKKDYWAILRSCSYAVFGMLRQQAMGNINYCIRHGIKLFLFKDSMNYQFLKSIGVEVFAIEEMDSNSFREPLSPEVQVNNNKALTDYRQYKNGIYEKVISNCFKL